MKVITEERLITLLDSEKSYLFNMSVRMLLINSLQEIDTLTVSKLRPMCDAPKDGTLIEVWHKKSPDPREAYFSFGFFIVDDDDVAENELAGWVPKIIYKPKLTGDGEKTAG